MVEFNKITRLILGRPNFTCTKIAERLRAIGLYEIEETAEDEQAATIHFLLCQYEKHGDKWYEKSNDILDGKP